MFISLTIFIRRFGAEETVETIVLSERVVVEVLTV